MIKKKGKYLLIISILVVAFMITTSFGSALEAYVTEDSSIVSSEDKNVTLSQEKIDEAGSELIDELKDYQQDFEAALDAALDTSASTDEITETFKENLINKYLSDEDSAVSDTALVDEKSIIDNKEIVEQDKITKED
ncbi:MAG: hypothetical protein DRN24_02355, partial [Thermoplasmata archaeon]